MKYIKNNDKMKNTTDINNILYNRIREIRWYFYNVNNIL